MTNIYTKLVFLCLVIFCCTSCGSDSVSEAADQSEQQFEAAGITNMRNDALFVAEAASASMLHLQLAEKAADRAVSPEVKELAQQLGVDHRRILDELRGVAEQQNFVLPAMLGSAHQKDYDEVTNKSGISFDLTYLKRVSGNYNTLLRRYEDMAQNGVEMNLKQFTSRQLPLLRQHDTKINQLEDQLNDL